MGSTEQGGKQVDVLISVYSAKKSEIARRSALQFAGITGYLYILYSSIDPLLSKDHAKAAIWIVLVWFAAIVTFLFCYSQQREIRRLSTDVGTVDAALADVLHTRSPLLLERWWPYPTRLAFLFDYGVLVWIVFLGLPALLTVVASFLFLNALSPGLLLFGLPAAFILILAIALTALLALLPMPSP